MLYIENQEKGIVSNQELMHVFLADRIRWTWIIHYTSAKRTENIFENVFLIKFISCNLMMYHNKIIL